MSSSPRILNWGCGHQWQHAPKSWICSDREDFAQHHVGDLLDGLPYPDGHFDGVVTHHALQVLDWHQLRSGLAELARVLRIGGWFRATVPDLMGGVAALGRNDRTWFPVNTADEPTVDGAFCTWATWFGENVTVFTPRRLTDLLERAGFLMFPAEWSRSWSPWGELAAVDDREGESILVEASKQ